MCSRVDRTGYPPPLPVKQRRSVYSGGSSTGSSLDMELEKEQHSPLGSLREAGTPSFSDVFSTSDCHAPRCPIHSAGPLSGHQERFFSENTPPPVPKKRLARALSLPGGCLHPRCTQPSTLQNYDNHLYMLAPIRDSQPDVERETRKPARESPPQRQPLCLLTFHTPDQQLPRFFKSLQDQEQVSLDIQQCHLLFLRRTVLRLETRWLAGAESPKGIESLRPHDFLLCEGYRSKEIGDAVFHAVRCPKLPGRVFSAKVYRPGSEGTALAHSKPLPPHINIQQLFVRFPQCTEPEKEEPQSSNGPAGPQQCDGLFPQRPDGGSTEAGRRPRTVASLLSEGYGADVERELPQATLEDFVRDGLSLRRSRPQLYERQLGLLLLQLTQALLHLRRHGAGCADLRPSDVTLAWPATEGGTEGAGAESTEGESLSTPVQKLWERRGPPRAVITALRPRSERDAGADSEEVRLGRLLQRCLHLPETPVTPDPGPAARDPPGLLQLALLLQEPESGVGTAEAAGILQALLWGPHTELLQEAQPGAWVSLLGSWLSVKRSLVVQKLSELALSGGDGGPDHEDTLCLQYLSVAEPEAVLKIAALLGLPHTAH
ncbi:inactive tyrosine-protein kinase PEAK1 [Conger conger]|uniref:inactive tyrosine-protein kinase PEAK1 n=1 Tax=Conger conger TaxID=82655 RepID=UPI002A5ACBAD|nr:inactive tyrosine-protein kinase PEAK1 [Conger conger]